MPDLKPRQFFCYRKEELVFVYLLSLSGAPSGGLCKSSRFIFLIVCNGRMRDDGNEDDDDG